MKNNRGQALPLALFILTFLCVAVGALAEKALIRNEKIQMQREADTLALMASTEQARALNSIAILNDGLKNLDEMLTIYAGAVILAGVCAFNPWIPYPPCMSAFRYLTRRGIELAKSVNQFGKNVKAMRKDLIRYGAISPQKIVDVYNMISVVEFLKNLKDNKKPVSLRLAFLFPLSENEDISHLRNGSSGEETYLRSRLHVFNPSDHDGEMPEGVSKSKCRTDKALDWERFNYLKSRFQFEANSHVLVYYRKLYGAESSPSTLVLNIEDEASLKNLRQQHENDRREASYLFQSADFKSCFGIKDFGIGYMPKPVLLVRPDFDLHQRSTIALVSFKSVSPLSQFLRLNPKSHQDGFDLETSSSSGRHYRADLWSLSEANVVGTDLMHDRFHAELTSNTKHKLILEHLKKKLRHFQNPLRVAVEKVQSDIDRYTRIGGFSIDLGFIDRIASFFGYSTPVIEFSGINLSDHIQIPDLPSHLPEIFDRFTLDVPDPEVVDDAIAH